MPQGHGLSLSYGMIRSCLLCSCQGCTNLFVFCCILSNMHEWLMHRRTIDSWTIDARTIFISSFAWAPHSPRNAGIRLWEPLLSGQWDAWAYLLGWSRSANSSRFAAIVSKMNEQLMHERFWCLRPHEGPMIRLQGIVGKNQTFRGRCPQIRPPKKRGRYV